MASVEARASKRITQGGEFAKHVNDLLDAVRDTYVGKASVAVVGLCLKVALVSTLTGARVPSHGTLTGPKWIPALTAYVALVCFAVFLKMMVHLYITNGSPSDSRKATVNTFVTGLNLIPAWGFKDCVAAAIAGESPMLAAVVVLLAATALALFVMPKSKDHEASNVPAQALYDLRVTLASCMGLGVGFAMDAFPQWAFSYFGLSWDQLIVMIIYPPAITFLVVLMQEGLSNLPGSETSFEDNPFFKTLVSFTKTCGNFWTAWAWHSLLYLLEMGLISRFPGASCYVKASWMALWALGILVLAATIITPMECKRTPMFAQAAMERDAEKLVELVAGMNVAFAFLDFMFTFYKCVHFNGYPVVGAWIFALLITVLMGLSTVAVSLFVEWAKKEDELLAEEAPLL